MQKYCKTLKICLIHTKIQMTDKAQILAYLAQVQGMQIAAKKVELVIDYDPKDYSFRIQMFDIFLKRHCFDFWAEFSENRNKCEMKRLTNSYNKFEHGNSNNSNNC